MLVLHRVDLWISNVFDYFNTVVTFEEWRLSWFYFSSPIVCEISLNDTSYILKRKN